MQEKISSYVLVVQSDPKLLSLSEGDKVKQEKLTQNLVRNMNFKIDGFFNPKYEIFISKMGGFHLDFSYLRIKQEKLRQI